MLPSVTLIGIQGMPGIKPGDSLGRLTLEAARNQKTPVVSNDILVITQKIVSKSEGRLVCLSQITPSSRARRVAKSTEKDPRLVEVILREARRIVRMDRGVIITETHHGFKCANSGVDSSNVGVPDEDIVALLPENPDASAIAIQRDVAKIEGIDVGVIISDTFGRPWREGAINVAIGAAGLEPLLDYRGTLDNEGRELQSTVIAIADELAAAAELVTNKIDRVPVAIIRGYDFPKGTSGVRSMIRDDKLDLFR